MNGGSRPAEAAPTERTGESNESVAHVSGAVADLMPHLLEAARLVDDLDAQREREDAAFREGFELGWHGGYNVGYTHAENDLDLLWTQCAHRVRAIANQPTHDELRRRRGEAS